MNSKQQQEMSIFNGAPSIHVDNNQIQREEEEALEDFKRRHAEIQNQLETELGNLSMSDDDDVNETRDSEKFFRNAAKQKVFPMRGEVKNLQHLVESKNREIEELSELLTAERRQHKTEVDEYEKRLTIFESEKDRALMSRNQVQENLVESKGKLIEINEQNDRLLSKIKLLENENEKLVGEIESTKLMLSDVQAKYNMVEKNVMFNAERNTDILIKQAQERHLAQIAMMQQQIDSLKCRYDDLEHDFKHLDIRYKELQKSRESMLIEKSETINQLNKNLEESQRQCQELLQRPDLMHENKRLQMAIQTIEYQKEDMSLTISKLQKKVQEQSLEIETMESIVNECSKNNQSFSEVSNFVNGDLLKNVTPLTMEAKFTKVMDELIKSQNNIKMKREEVKILEKQLVEKDKEIADIKSDENKLLIELNKYKDEKILLESKFTMLKSELEDALEKLGAFEKNREHYNRIQQELDEKIIECEDLRAIIDELKLDGIELNRMLENKEQGIHDSMKIKKQNQTDRAKCGECNTLESKIEELNLLYLESQKANDDYLRELNILRDELAQAQQSLEMIQNKISLQNVRDKEIENLQQKAKEFENYMRSTTCKSVSSPSEPSTSNEIRDQLADSPVLIGERNSEKRFYTESKIRDEMARIFANQIKTLEKRFSEETRKIQHHVVSLTSELDLKKEELEVATEQLELLKFTIVNERDEFQRVLKQKDDVFKERVERYQKHISDLNEQIELIEGERAFFENLKKQYEEERCTLIKKEDETVKKLKKTQTESKKIIDELTEKYKTAKKTAANYKQYSEDKEKHYRNECERIKNGYAEAEQKIQTRLNATIKENEETNQLKMKRLQEEYEFKISVLKEMLGKSQAL